MANTIDSVNKIVTISKRDQHYLLSIYMIAPRNFKYPCTDLTRKIPRLAASHVLFPSSLRVTSFQLTALLSLPHTGGSTLPRGKHEVAQVDILLHLRLFMFALFSSSTHPHAVHHQDVLSFSCPSTHYQLI